MAALFKIPHVGLSIEGALRGFKGLFSACFWVNRPPTTTPKMEKKTTAQARG